MLNNTSMCVDTFPLGLVTHNDLKTMSYTWVAEGGLLNIDLGTCWATRGSWSQKYI